MVLEEIPSLETERLRLRGHRREDLPACHTMWSDPAVVRYIGGHASTLEETWSRLLRYVGHWRLEGFGYWVLEDRQTGGFVGEAGFANFRREIAPSLNGVPELGWALTPSAHGKGLATEAARSMLEWGSTHLSASRIACLIHPENAPSIRIATKLGFGQEGAVDYKNQRILLFERENDPKRRRTDEKASTGNRAKYFA